jgi:hypothetical protein
MAIFALRSVKNVNEDNQDNTTTKEPSTRTTRPTAEPMIPFDDDMAHFVTHLDADPLAESHLKMHLVEYNYPMSGDGDPMIREITDDEDVDEEYTYELVWFLTVVSSRSKSCRMRR